MNVHMDIVYGDDDLWRSILYIGIGCEGKKCKNHIGT